MSRGLEPQSQLRKERGWRIWEALVRYANSGEPGELEQAFNESAELIPLIPIAPRIVDVDEVREYAGSTKDEAIKAALRYWAEQYHSVFRSALTWLCRPDKHPELADNAAQFLWRHSEGMRWGLKYANHKFDETGNEGDPIFLWPMLEHCRSIMSPICRFLIDRIWEFQEGRLALQEAIPLQICERDGCGNFTLAERQGRKRFCSDRCRALAYQGSRDDWNAYMRKYRKLRKRQKGKK